MPAGVNEGESTFSDFLDLDSSLSAILLGQRNVSMELRLSLSRLDENLKKDETVR
jgi:hypothetical protein